MRAIGPTGVPPGGDGVGALAWRLGDFGWGLCGSKLTRNPVSVCVGVSIARKDQDACFCAGPRAVADVGQPNFNGFDLIDNIYCFIEINSAMSRRVDRHNEEFI